MDIYVTTTIENFENLVKKQNFTIKWKKNHFSAMSTVPKGRYHILYMLLDGKVFCDFHYDNKIHGIGFGADYRTKPEKYFTKHLKEKLDQLTISYQIQHVNWFTRKNKAIITGLRF